jgi:hypothetical protein
MYVVQFCQFIPLLLIYEIILMCMIHLKLRQMVLFCIFWSLLGTFGTILELALNSFVPHNSMSGDFFSLLPSISILSEENSACMDGNICHNNR